MSPLRRWRRRLAGWSLRWRRWEFWPLWAFYPPIVIWVSWLVLRHGGVSVFTAVNTGLWKAGVIGASKSRILAALASCSDLVARSRLLAPDDDLDRRCESLAQAMGALDVHWPVVLKPDRGARGQGVGIVRGPSRPAPTWRSRPVRWCCKSTFPVTSTACSTPVCPARLGGGFSRSPTSVRRWLSAMADVASRN